MRSRLNLNQRLAQLEAAAAARKREEPPVDLTIYTAEELQIVGSIMAPDGSDGPALSWMEGIRRLTQEGRDRLRSLLERGIQNQRDQVARGHAS